jgi:hypothetical protein
LIQTSSDKDVNLRRFLPREADLNLPLFRVSDKAIAFFRLKFDVFEQDDLDRDSGFSLRCTDDNGIYSLEDDLDLDLFLCLALLLRLFCSSELPNEADFGLFSFCIDVRGDKQISLSSSTTSTSSSVS